MKKDLLLVMANINYSSWSVRPWLAMKHFGLDIETVVIPLGESQTAAEIAKHSPSGRLPLLRHGDRAIWDSLAICEYLAELHPERGMWPVDVAARAEARSVCAEMHSGFQALRTNMTCNCRARFPGQGRGPGVQDDIDRITAIWRSCRERYGGGGEFLFGAFSIADAFYGPVVSQFTTYGVEVDEISRRYMDAMWRLPAMRKWEALARAEPFTIAKYEK